MDSKDKVRHYWQAKKVRLPIDRMSDKHVQNTQRYVRRKLQSIEKVIQTLSSYGDGEIDVNHNDEYAYFYAWQHIFDAELLKRGLTELAMD